MKIIELIVTVLMFAFNEGEEKILKIRDDLQVKYFGFKMAGYTLTLKKLGNNTIHASFGCKNISLATVDKVIAFLEGKKHEVKAKRLIKKTSKDSRYLKSKVIEESKSFFIVDSGKTYPKSEYEIREVILKETGPKFADRWGYKVAESKATHIYLGDYRIATATKSDRDLLLKKALYIKEIVQETNKYLKTETK